MIEVVLGLGALGALWYFASRGQAHQSLTKQTARGPITVAVPVSSSPPSSAQANPASYAPQPTPKTALPIPNPHGVGANYAPAPVIVKDVRPGVLTLAPMVITPSGASSLSVTTVQDVQNGLNTLGYAVPPLAVDGKVGPKTSAAVKTFQMKHGLTIDGLVTEDLKAAVGQAIGALGASRSDVAQSPAVTSASLPAGPVATNAAPTDVDLVARLANGTASNTDLQHALNLTGATPALVEDGKLGPKSTAAVKAFQLAHGLTVDGIAGPKTKAALGQVVGGN